MHGRELWTRWGAALGNSLKRYRFVWLILLLGAVLLLIPGKGESSAEAETPAVESFSLSEMETRLSQALSRIEGAGEVTVILTLRNGIRQVLAEDVDRDRDAETSKTVVLKNEATVTVQEVYPTYQGALLVCSGGDDPTVRLKLTEAVTALTGLGADKIAISKGK